jgi:hypothetical protein
MYCHEFIIIVNRWCYFSIVARGDYNCWRDIPIGDWLQRSRYRLALLRKDAGGYWFQIFGKRKTHAFDY